VRKEKLKIKQDRAARRRTDHEWRRFASMTPKQLETRLVKMKNREKLDSFISMANKFSLLFPRYADRYRALADRARCKLAGDMWPGTQLGLDLSAER